MIDVLRRVAQIAQVLETDHVSDSPPGLVRHACQQVLAGDPGHFLQSSLRIPHVLEYLHHDYKVEAGAGERETLYVGDGNAGFRMAGSGQYRSLRIQVHSDYPWGPKATRDDSFSTSTIQDRVDGDLPEHLCQGPEETLVGETNQRILVGVLGLSGRKIGSRAC